MVENPMINYRQDRLPFQTAQDVVAYYAERRRRPRKPAAKPAIPPPPAAEGSHLDVRG